MCGNPRASVPFVSIGRPIMTIPETLQHLIRSDEPLAPLTWLGIGGPAHFFAEPVDRDQMVQVVTWAAENQLPTRILGSGSNVLVRESGFDGLVVSLAAAATSVLSIQGDRLTAGAGGKLSHAVVKAVGGGLGGLEHLVGIPGTVGAAVVGNVSSGGRDIGTVVESVRVMNPDGSYTRHPAGADAFNCHDFFMRHPSLSGRGKAGAGDVPKLARSRD